MCCNSVLLRFLTAVVGRACYLGNLYRNRAFFNRETEGKRVNPFFFASPASLFCLKAAGLFDTEGRGNISLAD
jgi:hypothetical protein